MKLPVPSPWFGDGINKYVSHWYRDRECEDPTPTHPITIIPPICGSCDRMGVDDRYNSWICPHCHRWMGQIVGVGALALPSGEEAE